MMVEGAGSLSCELGRGRVSLGPGASLLGMLARGVVMVGE